MTEIKNSNYTDNYILLTSEFGLCKKCRSVINAKKEFNSKDLCKECHLKKGLVRDAIRITRFELKGKLAKQAEGFYGQMQDKLGLPDFKEALDHLKDRLGGEK